jgi:hypothetical protein
MNEYINTSLIEEQYIGKNITYYSDKFHELRVLNKQTSWNWAAFLVPTYWCIYRKLYGYGFVLLLISLPLYHFGLFGDAVNIVIRIFLGLFANYIYMERIEHLVSEATYLEGSKKQQHLNNNSGVSPLTLVLVMIIYHFINQAFNPL